MNRARIGKGFTVFFLLVDYSSSFAMMASASSSEISIAGPRRLSLYGVPTVFFGNAGTAGASSR